MSYNYKEQRAELFTEEGVSVLLAVRDEAKRLIAISGAFNAEKAIRKASGSSWTMLAALDFMVERGELVRVQVGRNDVFVGVRHED